MLKWNRLGIGVLCLVALSTGCDFVSEGEHDIYAGFVDELLDRMDAVEETIAELQTSLDDAISELQSDVIDLQDQVAEHAVRLDGVESDVADLQTSPPPSSGAIYEISEDMPVECTFNHGGYDYEYVNTDIEIELPVLLLEDMHADDDSIDPQLADYSEANDCAEFSNLRGTYVVMSGILYAKTYPGALWSEKNVIVIPLVAP